MINKLLFKLSARLPCRHIRVDGRPYLERYYLGQMFGATFYLHRFLSSDPERHTHNHPWGWGRALVLRGGYDEEVATDLTTSSADGYLSETRRIRWWNRVDGSHFHRIANAKPGTWTLFFHGPRAKVDRGHVTQLKGWGFLSRGDHCVTFTPYAPGPSEGAGWWLTAPTGRDAGRVPLYGGVTWAQGPYRTEYVDLDAPRVVVDPDLLVRGFRNPTADEMYAEAAKLVEGCRAQHPQAVRNWRLTPRPSLSLREQTVGRVSRIVAAPCVLVGPDGELKP
jgi:hypothetical protein